VINVRDVLTLLVIWLLDKLTRKKRKYVAVPMGRLVRRIYYEPRRERA